MAERGPQRFTGEAAKFNYHLGDLSVSENGLLLYKAKRIVVPKNLRPGLLKALQMGHLGMLSMVLRAKDSFWWPKKTASDGTY